MIIFDLDGTLADCEHRRHFVDKSYITCGIDCSSKKRCLECLRKLEKDQPDWKSFYEACDKDTIILPVSFQFYAIREKFGICHPIQIWSGRCESVKEKTIDWLQMHFTRDINWLESLKMRPIGDSTPDYALKENWLNGLIWDYYNNPIPHNIDFVFDSDPASIAMWKRRGIFVFNCAQHDGQF